jgi:outer membrane receptor for Fe3+-dicitrate
MFFYITWNIAPENRVGVYNIFGKMTPEDDAKDAGQNIKIIGRWSELNGAKGHCICETSNTGDLYKWMLNWSPVCDIEVMPVNDDATTRMCVQTKDYFVKKAAM